MQTSEKGIALIKEFEGCKLTAYRDSVGVWTIGYEWLYFAPADVKRVQFTPISVVEDGAAE